MDKNNNKKEYCDFSVIKNSIKVLEERDVYIKISRKGKFKKYKAYSLIARVGKKKPARVIIASMGNGINIFYSIMRN